MLQNCADDINLIDKADDVGITNFIGDTVCNEVIYYIRSFPPQHRWEFTVHAHLAAALGAKDLLIRADEQLYKAKRGGKNQVAA